LPSAAFALALLTTPPAGQSASAGPIGLIRLGLYAAAAGLLALSGPSKISHWSGSGTPPALPADMSSGDLRSTLTAHALLGIGLASSLAVAAWNASRLHLRLDDSLGPAVWVSSMVLVGLVTLLPPVSRLLCPAGWH